MLNLPNAITLTRIALVVVFTAAVSVADRYSWGYLAALVTFILAACTDWLDGYLARRLNQVTTFGKLIDPLADKIAVSAAFIYLTGEGLCPAWITILIISREFLVTGLRQIAQDHGVIIPAGTSGKWKTAFQLAFCIACLLALPLALAACHGRIRRNTCLPSRTGWPRSACGTVPALPTCCTRLHYGVPSS